MRRLAATGLLIVLAVAGCSSAEEPPAPAPTSTEQDPGALRLEMNKLGSPKEWYHDIQDVFIDGGVVSIKVAKHDDHEPPSKEEILEICDTAHQAATAAAVTYDRVAVTLADAPAAGLDKTKNETACTPA